MPSMHASGASYAASPGADHPDLPSMLRECLLRTRLGLARRGPPRALNTDLCEPFGVILMDMPVLAIDGQEATSLRRYLPMRERSLP